MATTEGQLALADAVETVRKEIEEAIGRGQGSTVAFEAGPIEMEFSVEFSLTGSTDASVKAWVVNLGAKGEATRSSSNRITVSLQPIDRTTHSRQLIGDVDTK